MSFPRQLDSGLYSDKAVQTECPMAAPRRTDSSGTVSPSGIADLAINELLSRSGSAYRHSKPSRIPTPSLSGGHVNGKTWLDFNHPWDTRGVQRRVVSHPESVVCEPQTLNADSGRPRVVSLPERTSLKGCVSIQKHQHQDLGRPNREYPFDLPRTPSPPSSPDSIVIVGNKINLPSSFFPSHLDEDGWTTWANSPPRPIPALHGPSSLPYARCPSGAEGTVVEGDDLASKVWGLGSDEPHRLRLKSPQPPRFFASSASLPLDDNIDYQRVTSSALARHRDAVIDLAKPATLYCSSGTLDSAGDRSVSLDGAYPSPAGHPGRQNLSAYTRSYRDMHSEKVTTVTTKDRPEPTLAALARGLVARSQGLPQTRKSNLNSAAQSFVPAYPTRDVDSERACIQDAEFGDLDYTHTSRDSHQQHASSSELTPASTASPLWSPVFQSIPTIVSGDYNPRIYSPQTDLDSYSNKFTTQQLNSEDFLIVQQRLHTEQGIKSSIETFYAQPYVANIAIGGIRPSALASCNSTEANQVELCERPCHQQPRSVPMACLQRRLSSVVEENILGSYEFSRVHTKTAGKALRQAVLVPGQSNVSNIRETEMSDGGESSSSSGR